ncbi:unnamed protein product [Mytilus coruscus]|uniref:Uncharacterized protein n=1 Tax=Mytilus coruscus TaxID=42192 RepID=A0A6J8A581_MYTCO|nr:unnamed protein product [Mytilus coruscus]
MRALSASGESFGIISHSRKHNDLEFDVRKKDKAQLLLPSVNKLSNIKFTEKANFQLPKGKNGIYISGCTILPEGLFVFVDEVNSRLIIYDSGGNFIREIPLSFSPRDVAYIYNSNIGVTCMSAKKVVLVELISGKQLSSFSSEDTWFGLSFLNENVTIRITGTFLTTTLEGEIKSRVKGDGLTHCCAGEGCVLSSNYSNHSVLCYKTNGDLAWQFQNPKLQTPRDVTVDENGCVLVTGETSNKLFAISPNGQVWREILNNLDKPYAIEYDKASRLMPSTVVLHLCLKESHVHCEKLETIQDVVKNINTSPLLEDTEKDLKFIMTNLDSLIKNRQENKTRINAQKLACMEEIQNVRKLINDRLDEMEKRSKDTMASYVEELGLDFDNFSQELNVNKSHISALQEELEAALFYDRY